MNFAVLRHRDFALFVSGNALSWLGSWMQRISIGWLSWDLTHSSLWVGLISLAMYAPVIVLGPLFGVLADKLDRRWHGVIVNAIQMLLAVTLFLISIAGSMRIELLFAVCILIGIAGAAYQPVRLSLVNDIVPRELLTQAIAVNSVVFNASRFVGPALGGIAIASLGVASTFAINAITYVGVISALWVVVLRPPTHRHQSSGFFADLLAGLRNVAAHRAIRSFMLMGAITSVFARGVLELLPVFADAVFMQGASGLAILTSAGGIGAVVAGLTVSRFNDTSHLPRLSRRSAFAAGAILIMLGLTTNFWLGVFLVFAIAVATTLCMVSMQIAVQSAVDDPFRGRVMSLWGVIAMGGPSIGGAAIGAIAQFTGMAGVTIACGVVGMTMVWMAARAQRQDRRP
ncbi:MAG: MFS transporter [Burkholderiales bacterium]